MPWSSSNIQKGIYTDSRADIDDQIPSNGTLFSVDFIKSRNRLIVKR